MQRTARFLLNGIFFIQVLILFLFFFKDRLSLPAWLQVAGRLHPALLHIPIGGLAFAVVLEFMREQIKKKAFQRISFALILLTSLAASVTALLGMFMAAQGDYGADAVAQHRNSGIILSFLCYFLALALYYTKRRDILFYGLGIVTAGTVVFAGHTGSILTHGENFVLAPLNKSQPDLGEAKSAFQQVVFPILEKKCVTCHNRAKAKGHFVMTSLEEFQKGGTHGKEWVPGNPSQSRMIQYIHLPLELDDHMPPDGKPQLTKSEIRMLESWIAAGADVDKMLVEYSDQDSFKILGVAALALQKPETTEEKQYTFSPATEETIQKMNTPFRAVFPLFQKSPALQADFFIRESFKPASLEELKEVKDQLVVLNLSKMPVTDNELNVIGTFGNLEKLNLNFSKITGTGLSALQPLSHLYSLSLAGTAITPESLAPVLSMPSLRDLFLWNTGITEEEKTKMAAAHKGLSIVTTEFKDDQILQLDKPRLVNEGVLKKDERVALRHPMPGVSIRYTLDGSSPDSVTSSVYESPFPLTATSTLKAIACRPGWYCSPVFETTCFVEGIKPVTAELLSPPDKSYPGERDKSLTDLRKGTIQEFKEASWLGYQNDPFVAGFDFGTDPPVLHSIIISYGKNIGSYIMPPEQVEVWAGPDSKQAKLIQTMKIPQPTTYETPQLAALVIPLKESRYPFYKVVAKPVAKLPAWHSGKGKKGWVFVDEVFFY